MNPRDFHRAAEEFVEGDSEAHWRSATSRAYYAAFLVGRQVLQRCGFRVPRADGAHNYVIWRLSNSGDCDVRGAGSELDILRTSRNQADYEVELNVAQWEAEARVESAREIIETLDAALADPALLAAITQAMRDYERDTLGVVTFRS
ncbi:MAG: HEPN domain-containing protein [Gemmataceae bacterium]|nr:HEPN domain-containing protein [Gemmataceae bacterium]